MGVMSDVHVVVLAAGKGTRMKSARPKVLHRVAGAPDDRHVLRAAADACRPQTHHGRRRPQADDAAGGAGAASGLTFVVQEPQLGTAHALLTTEPVLRERDAARWSCCRATSRC